MKNMWNFPPSHLVMYLQLILMTIKSVNLDKNCWQGQRGGRALPVFNKSYLDKVTPALCSAI